MCKLQITKCVGFILLIAMVSGSDSMAGNFAPGDIKVFYPDGKSRDDGYVVLMDISEQKIIVNGDGLLMRPCGAVVPGRGCINSDYFTFFRGDGELAAWSFGEFSFEMVGSCSLSSSAGGLNAVKVSSAQKGKDIDFYTDPSGELYGWTVSYPGDVVSFLRKGVGLGNCAAGKAVSL